MQKHYLIFSLILFSHFLVAQTPKWINYADFGIVWDVLPTNEYVWVSTQGGLERIDRVTGQRKIIQPWNSGLRGIDVGAVDIAPDGKMWVSGNSVGLSRFDGGESWEQFYAINTGDTLIEVKELKVTSEGKLWFISFVNDNCWGCTKLFHYDGSAFSEHTDALETILGNNSVRSLAVDTSGIVWVGSSYSVARYDGALAVNAAIPLATDEAIVEMAFDHRNTLWVGTQQYTSGSPNYVYRIRYFDGNAWSVLDESTLGGPIFQTYKMFNDKAGNFYVSMVPGNGSGSAFAKFDGNTWEYHPINDLPNVPSDPPYELVSVDSQGIQWFLGSKSTFYEFDGQNWKSHKAEIYPSLGTYVYDVAFDCEQNTWFAGGGLFAKFDGVSWKNYTIQDMGINANYYSIWSLTTDTTNCDIWISFYENNQDAVGFAKFDGTTFTKYSTPDGYDVLETAIAKDGTVWVASASSGLGKFDGNTWTWLDEQNSPVNSFVWSVTIDHEQDVWISTGFPTKIIRRDENDWYVFDQSNSPVSEFSYWVFVDHAGMIWTSSSNGLLRFDGVEWKAFTVPGTEGHGIYSMAQDQAHNFWISNKTGIHKWDGNAFESFDFLEHPLANAYSWRIRIDPFGNKWMVHNAASGVTVFNENGISNQVINPDAGVYGTVFFDANQDGQQGQASAEPGIPNEKVYLQPNNTAIFTNYDGNYTLFPPPGNYQLDYTGSEDYTPTSAQSLPLNMGTNELNGFDYGAWAENPEDSIALDMTIGNMRCGGEVNVWLSLVGYGLLEASGDITLLFDPALTFLHASPEPDVVQGNLLTWHYSGLSLYELQQFNAVFKVPGPDSVGQILTLQSDANVLDGGVVTATAEKNERAVIRCSFDPNDKSSTSVGASVGQFSLLNDALDFTIRFQNTGNDTAFTVVLRDTLDSALDFSSLQLVASSHAMRVTLTSEGVLTFVFDKINLLWESIDYAGSQGFVKYRIAPKVGVPDPTVVNNTAYIFFDFNPAITTNTTTNILVETLPTIAAEEPANQQAKAVKVYPNPNSGDFFVEWLDDTSVQTSRITILDMLGRTYLQSVFDQKIIQIHDLPAGFFFVVLEKGGKTECRKLVVTKQ